MAFGWNVLIERGVEINVGRYAYDKRLKFPQNWTAKDMAVEYYRSGIFNEKSAGIYRDGKEALAVYGDLCKDGKSEYFYNCGVPFIRFDVARIDVVEIDDDDGNKIGRTMDTLMINVAGQEVLHDDRKDS